MSRVACRLLVLCLLAASATAAPVAQHLVPSIAPRGARALIVGGDLGGDAIKITFRAAGGQTVAADIVSRSAQMLEVIVPSNTVSGSVEVSSGSTSIGRFDFVLAPDPAFSTVATLAGGPGTGNNGFKEPWATMVVIPDGRIFVADSHHHQVREISPSGQVSVFAGTGSSGLKNGARAAAEFKEPKGLAYDPNRRVLYVADSGNAAIRAIAGDGTVTTLAGGKSGDRDGSGTQAEFKKPSALAVDSTGNIYVADAGNHKIRKITPAGQVTTFAGNGQQKLIDGAVTQAAFNEPEGITLTRSGSLLVCDTKNHVVRLIEGGMVSTLAGSGKSGFVDGAAPQAEFKEPRGIIEDEAGDVLVTDTLNARIRKIVRNASPVVVITVAGSGKTGHVDGPVATAEFKDPTGLGHAGALFIGDTKNDAVRAIWPEVKATALYPPSGSLRAGVVEVKVFGSGFVPGRTTVKFGTQPTANVTFVSSTELVASTPVFQATGKVDVAVTTPAGTAVLKEAYSTDTDPPMIQASVTPAASADGWHRVPVTVHFHCFDPTSAVASCTAPVTLTQEGANQRVRGTAVDLAGNTASATAVVNVDLTAPLLSIAATPETTRQNVVTVSGTSSDALSGLRSVLCNGASATMTAASFTCSASLFEGTNTIRVIAQDRANNAHEKIVSVLLDTTQPVVMILSPEENVQVNASSLVVEADAADEDRIASVTINGTAATLSNDRYRASVSLAEGANTITATATDRAGNIGTASRSVTFFSLPAVAITAPADLAVVSSAAVTVTGTVSGSGVSVTVNGTQATVSGGTFTASNIPLVQGRTVITAKAVNAAGHVATANIHVYRDSIPPRVEVYSPAEGQIVSQSPITVSGMVDDVAVGTINSGQARVTVNGIEATVANRAFTARKVALTPGLNVLTIVGIDQGGNQVSETRRVTLDPAAGLPRVLAVSGGDQSAGIGTQLPTPLVVRLLSATGASVAGQPVSFRVAQNDGTLSDGVKQDRSLVVTTNAGGEASVRWTLGMRAGAGNQRVEASSVGFAGKVDFMASGLGGTPDKIVVDAGNGQFGVTGERLQRPLIAVVIDKGSNRIANVPVTFTVAQGGGRIDGQQSVTVRTDSDGRAWVVPALGPEAGIDNNIFTASVSGVTGMAAFYATGRPAGPIEQTQISGVVVDNSNIPVAGVSVRIEGATLATQTNAQGRFAIRPAPVGYVKLIIDGSTAQRPGTWPTLEFAMYTNAGQNNTVGMPIYILPIDVARGIQVNEQKGGTLTLPELPGFSLTVAPGAATFPNGSRSGTVSVTLVHSDKMPMPPGFGQQPRFIVTIQPTGVHFDPPAAITFPNVDGLRPGQVTEMYSFDHDLGQFVSIGTGSISEDGTTLRSDPGVGIIKGGWHCGGDPTPTGTSADCGVCAQCNGTICEPNPLFAGRQCTSDGQPCTDDVCVNGVCSHPALQSRVSIEAKYVNRDDPSHTWTRAAVLVLGQPLYGSNPTASDHARWQVNIETTKPVASYQWIAKGPQIYNGPAAAQWQVDNISWTPGFYVVEAEVTFQGGCKIKRSWGQHVGVRTRDYVLYGSIMPESDETTGVLSSTIDRFVCLDGGARIVFGGVDNGFNEPSSNSFVPEREPDRHYVMQRIFSTTANRIPVPSDLDTLREINSGNVNVVAGLDGLNYFRQASRVQFKYLVKDGRILGYPVPVGDVFAVQGMTPVPCTALPVVGYPAGLYGDEHARNGMIEMYADGTGFSFIAKVRAGSGGQAGYAALNRRTLAWAFFRFRFDVQDGSNKTRIAAGASEDWDGPDDKDYSWVPTFFLYERVYSGGEYNAVLQPGFPIPQSLNNFLRISPKLPGGGPYYPNTP